jgi:hypothetical protein
MCNFWGKMTLENNPVFGMSIDRINCNKGYKKGNIQLVTTIINKIKGDIEWLKKQKIINSAEELESVVNRVKKQIS